MGDPAELDPSPYGVNLHTAAELLPTFASIGVRWFRIDVDWDATEPTRGEYAWKPIDSLVESADDYGVAVLASIAYTPVWASDDLRWKGLSPDQRRAAPPKESADYVRFIRDVLTRYGPKVKAVGLWNEPDQPGYRFWRGTLEEYLQLLVPALMAVRDCAPDVVTCGPDLSGWREETWLDIFSPNRQRQWLGQILARTERIDARGPLLDVIAHHQYGGDDVPSRRIAVIDDLHRFLTKHLARPRPLWITETGWATDKEPSLDRQAEHLEATFESMLARRDWWEKTFWYDSNSREGKAEWGLLGPEGADDAGKPRPTFRAYGRFIAEHGGSPGIRLGTATARVRAAYEAVLDRSADAGGLEAHVALLRHTTTRDVCAALLSSDEFANRKSRTKVEEVAAQFFRGGCLREPTSQELATAVSSIDEGRAATLIATLIDQRFPPA